MLCLQQDDQNRLKTMGLETWLKTIAQGKNGVRRTEYLQGGSSKRRRSMVGLHSRRGDTTKLQAGWSPTMAIKILFLLNL